MLEQTATATTAATAADQDRIHDEVRARYAEAAIAAGAGRSDSEAQASCCDTHGNATFGQILYDADDRAQLPDTAVLASLGCGNPTAVAELRPGERVLDLGSGGGIDVILSARRVGPTGRAIGLDMTDEMLELAVRNAAEAGVDNVEFVRGTIESIPLPAASVDVVISNCVINLAADKAAVFAEIARVLRPGGRVGVSDVVADDSLTAAERAGRGSYSGCIAGALSFAEYRTGLAAVGLVDVTIEPTHAVADGLHGAIIKATRPVEAVVDRPAMPAFPRAVAMLDAAADGCGCGSGVCC
jgi:SAM-dependent methyltransferase